MREPAHVTLGLAASRRRRRRPASTACCRVSATPEMAALFARAHVMLKLLARRGDVRAAAGGLPHGRDGRHDAGDRPRRVRRATATTAWSSAGTTRTARRARSTCSPATARCLHELRCDALAPRAPGPSGSQSSQLHGAGAARDRIASRRPIRGAAGVRLTVGLRQRALREPARGPRDRDPAGPRGGHQGAEDAGSGRWRSRAYHRVAAAARPRPPRLRGAERARRGRRGGCRARRRREEVAHQRRPHARGAVLLGLLAPADADALEGVGEGRARSEATCVSSSG